jgi:hypothetical protein
VQRIKRALRNAWQDHAQVSGFAGSD